MGHRPIKYVKRVGRIVFSAIFTILIVIVLLLGGIFVALQFPAVQTALLEKVTSNISEKTGFEHSAARVNVIWPNALSLEGVLIKDRNYRPMIEVGRLDIQHDFWPIVKGLFKGNLDLSKGLYLNDAMLYRPNVWLVYNKQTGQLNINEWVDALAALSPPDTIPKKQTAGTPFGIRKIQIVDGQYRMDDPRLGYIKKGFDHNHFTIQKINGSARNFFVLGDTLIINVKNLTAKDKGTGIAVNRLDTKFFLCNHKMEFGDLYGNVGNSHFQNYFAMHYKSFDDFGDYNNKVIMKAHLGNSVIHSKDLGIFSEFLAGLNETWRAKGDFEGTTQDFRFDGQLSFGKNSYINGKTAIKNVLDYEHSPMKFDLANSRIDAADIRQYYPEKTFNTQMQKFGVIDIAKGKFDGTFDNFVVNGNYKTALGNADGSLKLDLRPSKPIYDGNIKTQEFDLGTLLDDPTIGKVAVDGRIKGSGFSVKDATMSIAAKLPKIQYNGYTYRNTVFNGNLQKRFFEGMVSVRDSNLKADVDGNFDFTQQKYVYSARGRIEKADLRALKLMKDSLTLHTDLEIDMSGNNIDELEGTGKFLNSYAITNKRNLVVDTLLIDSKLQPDSTRRLAILSEFLNFYAQGKFKPTVAVADLAVLFKEYQLAFVGTETSRQNYYLEKVLTNSKNERYEVNYKADFKQMEKLMAFLYPDGYVSNGSKAEGSFTMDKAAAFNFEGVFDTLKLAKNTFYKNTIELNSSKFKNNPEVIASVNIISKEQKIDGLPVTEKLDIESSWDKDHIAFRSKIRQKNSTTRAALNGDLQFVGDVMRLQFKKSKLQLIDSEWIIPSNNLITSRNGELSFRNLALENKDQQMSINGQISMDSLKTLAVSAKNLSLASFNPLLATKISGLVNGELAIKDFYRNSIYDSNLTIDKFVYNGQEIGDITADADWDAIDKHLHINAHLDKAKQKIIALTGIIDPNKKGNELDLVAKFNDSELKALNAFTEGLLSDISGRANGTVKIQGSLANPKFDGEVAIQKGRLTLDYLKAVFAFEDKIYFDEDVIRVKNTKLTDSEGNQAILQGGVFYDGFENYSLDFNAQLRNFKMLNTTIKDNQMFYGTAYATGKFEMWGPINNLTIKPTLTPNKGTKIYIPLDGVSEVASQEFVQFVAPPSAQKDSLLEADKLAAAIKKDLNSANFKLDMQLNMTTDALCEILIDRQLGHGIAAFGQGPINMTYDTRTDNFLMFGNFVINNGTYNFNYPGLSKRLQIQQGGRISWTGNPYAATLDLKASYIARTSLRPIITSASTTDNSLNRRYPVEVTMALTEKLTAPNIRPEIKFVEYPSQYSLDITAAESALQRDEQFLKNQLFGLLVVNLLIPQDKGFLFNSASTASNLVGNSVGEFISNQVSKFASSLNENLEVGVSGFDASTTFTNFNGTNNSDILNNIQLRFSYNLFNNRFRITRDGRLNYGNSSVGNASNLLLDWTLEYWVTSDGTQRLKMFNRNLQNQFTLTSAGAVYGVSFSYSKSFNHFMELSMPEERRPKPPKANSISQSKGATGN